MEKKQTAVDWFYEEIQNLDMENNNGMYTIKVKAIELEELFDYAKQKEKEIILTTYWTACLQTWTNTNTITKEDFEQFYTDNYNN